MFASEASLSFFWSERTETATACAARLKLFLDGLVNIEPKWRKMSGISETEKMQLLPRSQAKLEQFLLQCRNRRDDNKAVIEDLGYSLTLACDEPGGFFQASLSCGVYSKWNLNKVAMPLAVTSETDETELRLETLLTLAELTVSVWEPFIGIGTHYSIAQAVGAANRFQETGWITYLSFGYGELPMLPSYYGTKSLKHGTLVWVKEDPFLPKRKAHANKVLRLSELLNLKERCQSGHGK